MTRKHSLMDRRFPKTSLNDSNEIDISVNERNLSSKVDSRTTTDYTFLSTAFETINHTLGRIPKGIVIIDQNQAAIIVGDRAQWTKKTVTLKSNIASNATRIQFI